MRNTNRRELLAATAALAVSAAAPALSTNAFAEDAPKVDLTDLATPPEEGDMSVGPDTAKVTIIEYGSASCPHCADFYKDVFVKLKTDYVDKGTVKFIFREYPHNDQGLAAFMVARCAPKEKYFPLLDAFFTTQPAWVPDAFNGLKNIAQQAGMPAADFEACLKNEKVVKGIMAVRDKANKSYGIQGIPTLFVNGKTYEGERTYVAMKAIIDPLLK
jgi:protein-disulfide isomerase